MAEFLERGEYRQFSDLRGSWRKRDGGVFERGLILQCTLCVVSMVDTSQSGRLVTSCHMFFSQHNALLVMNSKYIQTAHVFERNFKPQLQVFEFYFSGSIISSEKSPPTISSSKKEKCIHHFLLVCSSLDTCSVVLCYQSIQSTYRPNKLKT